MSGYVTPGPIGVNHYTEDNGYRRSQMFKPGSLNLIANEELKMININEALRRKTVAFTFDHVYKNYVGEIKKLLKAGISVTIFVRAMPDGALQTLELEAIQLLVADPGLNEQQRGKLTVSPHLQPSADEKLVADNIKGLNDLKGQLKGIKIDTSVMAWHEKEYTGSSIPVAGSRFEYVRGTDKLQRGAKDTRVLNLDNGSLTKLNQAHLAQIANDQVIVVFLHIQNINGAFRQLFNAVLYSKTRTVSYAVAAKTIKTNGVRLE